MSNLLTKEILERAKICNDKQYHISNLIQPQYILLVLNPADYRIIYASDNAPQLFRLERNQIIGNFFPELLDNYSAKRLGILLEQEKIQSQDYSERLPARITIAESNFATEALFYRNKDYICVEIESEDFKSIDISYLDLLFFRLVANINSYKGDSANFSSLICKTIHKIIGCDRIWYCEFDNDGNGYVSGEYSNGVFPSLMHHHFPSTDVPNVVRDVYVKNKCRAILNGEVTPAIVTDVEGKEVGVIDLTYSIARMPAQSHLEYLHNMGVKSSASFSVVKDGKLIALFGAHSKCASLIRYRQLVACQYLVDKYLVRYELLHQNEEFETIAEKERQADDLIKQISIQNFDLKTLIKSEMPIFFNLLNADGCFYLNSSKFYGSINLSTMEQQNFLKLIIDNIDEKGIFHTFSLASFGMIMENKIAGILAIRLSKEEDNDNEFLIWYRKEHAYSEKWAGNPSQAVLRDASGKVGPRISFDSWTRTVEGTSVPWKKYEVIIAEKFKNNYILMAALYQAKSQKQVAEKANAYKSQFLANMSHELRTPLHTMIGFVESIMEKIDTMPKERQLRYLEMVHNSSERLLDLINDLLDLTKLEAGMMRFCFAKSDLRHVIDEAIKETNKLIAEKSLNVDIHADSEIILVFDQQRLIQVMINMLSNAAKFTPNNKNIDIWVRRQKNNTQIEISDQGIGIPEDELDKVFDKFVQSSKTKTGTGGTGLGLSICKEIAQAHKGKIWVKNNESGGASFFFEFPDNLEEKTTTL